MHKHIFKTLNTPSTV